MNVSVAKKCGHAVHPDDDDGCYWCGQICFLCGVSRQRHSTAWGLCPELYGPSFCETEADADLYRNLAGGES
jgi:hypothetical protein